MSRGYDRWVNRPTGMSDREFFSPHILQPGEEIVVCASKRMTFFAAVKGVDGIRAVVCNYHWLHTYYYLENFEFTVSEENEYPTKYNCPARVLDVLSPVEQLYSGRPAAQYVSDWREKCREQIKIVAARPSVHKGDKVVFERPINFVGGAKQTELIFEKGSTFTLVNGNARYCIRNWRDRKWTVVPAAELRRQENLEKAIKRSFKLPSVRSPRPRRSPLAQE